MALKITGLSRAGGPGCNHWRITVDVDGTTKERILHQKEIMAQLDDFPGGHRGALVLAWIRYQLANGTPKSRLLNVDIAPIVGP